MGQQSKTYKMSDFQEMADQFLTLISTIDITGQLIAQWLSINSQQSQLKTIRALVDV